MAMRWIGAEALNNVALDPEQLVVVRCTEMEQDDNKAQSKRMTEFLRCVATGKARDVERFLQEDESLAMAVVHGITCVDQDRHSVYLQKIFPLFVASYYGQLDVVKLLVEKYGADPRQRADGGRQGVHAAALNGHKNVVSYFVESFDDMINMPCDSDKNLPIHLAAAHGHRDLVIFLLENGAVLNARDNFHLTPLMWAVGNAHEEIVKLLLRRGADPTIREKLGNETPRDIARRRKLQTIEHMLYYAEKNRVPYPWRWVYWIYA